jgi:hypothetical protein
VRSFVVKLTIMLTVDIADEILTKLKKGKAAGLDIV